MFVLHGASRIWQKHYNYRCDLILPNQLLPFLLEYAYMPIPCLPWLKVVEKSWQMLLKMSDNYVLVAINNV